MTFIKSTDDAIREYKRIRTRIRKRMINNPTPMREFQVFTFTLTIEYLRYLQQEYLRAKAIVNAIQQEQIMNV